MRGMCILGRMCACHFKRQKISFFYLHFATLAPKKERFLFTVYFAPADFLAFLFLHHSQHILVSQKKNTIVRFT